MNRHDAHEVGAFFTQDCVLYDPAYPEPLKGRAAVEKDAVDFFRAFPDFRIEVINLFEKGDHAALEVRMTGANTGPLATPMGELPATGKRIDLLVFWSVVSTRTSSSSRSVATTTPAR